MTPLENISDGYFIKTFIYMAVWGRSLQNQLTFRQMVSPKFPSADYSLHHLPYCPPLYILEGDKLELGQSYPL